MSAYLDFDELPFIQELKDRPLAPSVAQTSDFLKRCYVLLRGALHATAGWIVAVEHQELKFMLCRHLDQTAQLADELRVRILQLRYPRRDVDGRWDSKLVEWNGLLLNAPDQGSFAQGVYEGLQPALQGAFERYLESAEPIADLPTVDVLNAARELFARQRVEWLQIRDEGPRAPKATAPAGWADALRAALRACGGVEGAEEQGSMTVPAAARTFERPNTPGRDPRYQHRCELLGHCLMFWNPESAGLTWVSHAIMHFNELWAAEMTAAVMFDNPNAPWELQLDAARWCHDEARHCQLGVSRLQSAGFDIYAEIPAPDTITFSVYEPDHRNERMLAVHCFERGGVMQLHKQAAMNWHNQQGEAVGGRHFDFDWADESIHLHYGLKWIKHLMGEETLNTGFEAKMREAVELRRRNAIEPLVKAQEAEVEAHFRRLCERLGCEFAVTPIEALPLAPGIN